MYEIDMSNITGRRTMLWQSAAWTAAGGLTSVPDDGPRPSWRCPTAISPFGLTSQTEWTLHFLNGQLNFSVSVSTFLFKRYPSCHTAVTALFCV